MNWNIRNHKKIYHSTTIRDEYWRLRLFRMRHCKSPQATSWWPPSRTSIAKQKFSHCQCIWSSAVSSFTPPHFRLYIPAMHCVTRPTRWSSHEALTQIRVLRRHPQNPGSKHRQKTSPNVWRNFAGGSYGAAKTRLKTDAVNATLRAASPPPPTKYFWALPLR